MPYTINTAYTLTCRKERQYVRLECAMEDGPHTTLHLRKLGGIEPPIIVTDGPNGRKPDGWTLEPID